MLCLAVGFTAGYYTGQAWSNEGEREVERDYSGYTDSWIPFELVVSPTSSPSPSPSPTPTPEPVATPAPEVENVVLQAPPDTVVSLPSPHPESFDGILSQVFGGHAGKAYRVADCETGYKISAGIDPFWLNQTSVGAAGEVSIWQIHPIHVQYDRNRLQSDLAYAAQAAWELSGYGANWTGPWRHCGWQ